MNNKLDKLLELDCPIYVDKSNLKGNFTKLNSVRINANIREDELEQIDFYNVLYGKEYLIIDMDASSDIHQRKFLSIIKDKKYKTFYFKDLKIIVTSTNIDTVSKEVLGLLAIL